MVWVQASLCACQHLEKGEAGDSNQVAVEQVLDKGMGFPAGVCKSFSGLSMV